MKIALKDWIDKTHNQIKAYKIIDGNVYKYKQSSYVYKSKKGVFTYVNILNNKEKYICSNNVDTHEWQNFVNKEVSELVTLDEIKLKLL